MSESKDPTSGKDSAGTAGVRDRSTHAKRGDMREKLFLFGIVSIAAWQPGCMQVPQAGAEDADRDGEGSASADVTIGSFDVGVIPDANLGCPAGSEEIVIRMDDEDDANGSSQSGWIGKTNSGENGQNTRLYFCRVNGQAFRPFTGTAQAPDLHDDYAVLKLGALCPPESEEFSRYYDNENDSNQNWFSGTIFPNMSFDDTVLSFCLFRYSPSNTVQTVFPSFGSSFHYGVFAPADSDRGLASGTFTSDDEDTSNGDGYGVSSDALFAAQRIIQPVNNPGGTLHHVIKAR